MKHQNWTKTDKVVKKLWNVGKNSKLGNYGNWKLW
jgi:hypothetical protein